MTKKWILIIGLLLIACPMLFAQAKPADTSDIAQRHAQWMAIAGGFSMAIASGLCGLAQAKAVAAAAEGTARNPGATAAIRFALILGLIFIESLSLYTFAIVFLKVQ